MFILLNTFFFFFSGRTVDLYLLKITFYVPLSSRWMSVFLIKNNQPECTDEFVQHCLLFFPVQITGLSTYLCQGCFFTGLWGKGVIFVVVLLVVIFCKLTLLLFLNTGTPCQETWPGISSSDEFRNYNFPKYKPQPLINHAPRYFVFYLKEHMHSYSFEYL